MKTIKATVLTSLSVAMMFLSLADAQPQTYAWSTIAGSAGHSGSVDGTNSAARFSAPGGMAVDSAGNLYVADQNNGTIRKLTPVATNWVSSTIAGLAGRSGSADGTNSAIRFQTGDNLGWVAVGSSGNVFVADWGNNTIRQLTPVGTNWVSSTIAGLVGQGGSADGTNRAARFSSPNDVAVDSVGNLFVADFGNSTIRKLMPAGTNWVTSTIAGLAGHSGSADGTNSAARFSQPDGLRVDSAGNVFVAEYANNTIRKGVPLPVFQGVKRANDRIEFTWSAAPGQRLQLQYSSDLISTNWANLGNAMTATNGTMSASDAFGPDTTRFYRIILLP